MYLAYDPGKVTGWARFNDDGSAHSSGQVTLEELMDHVNVMENLHPTEPIKAVIYEDFVLFRHKAQQQTGSRMEASQAIGIIKKLGKDIGCEVVVQPSTIKGIAKKWTGLVPPSDHSKSHWIDAFNHGAYYLINKGIRKTALEEQQGK